MLIGKITVSKTVGREFDSLHSCMKFLIALVPSVILVVFIAFVYVPLAQDNEFLIAKTRVDRQSDEQKIASLEKAKVEQFYRGIYEVCLVVSGDGPKCLSVIAQGVKEDFYNEPDNGWIWPLTNRD